MHKINFKKIEMFHCSPIVPASEILLQPRHCVAPRRVVSKMIVPQIELDGNCDEEDEENKQVIPKHYVENVFYTRDLFRKILF